MFLCNGFLAIIGASPEIEDANKLTMISHHQHHETFFARSVVDNMLKVKVKAFSFANKRKVHIIEINLR